MSQVYAAIVPVCRAPLEWRRSCSPPLTFTRTTHTSVHSLAPGYGAWAVEPETVHSPKAAPYVALGLVMLSSTRRASLPLPLSYETHFLLTARLAGNRSMLRSSAQCELSSGRCPFRRGRGGCCGAGHCLRQLLADRVRVCRGCTAAIVFTCASSHLWSKHDHSPEREREPDPLVLVPVLPYRPIRSRSIQQRDVQPARM